jgi:hypothetical protein
MANGEDAYEASVKLFKAEAAAIECAWAALGDGSNASKAAACPSLIKATGYSAMGWRAGRSVWADCPRCAASGVVVVQRVSVGCRGNGDAYGSNLHMCKSCGFTDYYSWDEA